ncbi:MAG TPA: NADPH:quinone oxidoreductase family protein [Solirubrobacterales bacterium]|nr:NADPH:quinone oxidoreductase family protein [Solirubrobacterales bacterium]
MKAIQVQEFGGPEVMELVELPDPAPSDGEVLVEVARCGINFGDTHATRDDYLAKQSLPLIPGGEIAGRTAEGRRVAAFLPSGGYAERVAVPESWLVDIPGSVDDEQAAGLLVQGLTAHALVHRCGQVRPGETVVVQAAAGGTGTLAVQLAKRAGARVIALASSDEKREFAMRVGADAAVDSRAEDLKGAILDANDGRQVDVVFEMTGGAAFEACLRTLAPFGRMVLFGIASREQNQIRSGHLLQNSRAVIGFWLVHLVSQREEVATMIRDLLEAVAAGQLEVIVGEVYPMSEARRAHEDLAGRRTTGKLLLDPSR